ncbi:MAG: dicarboxylate/amino acid:cation symporter [Gammaproteobacteria bacterium]|nr:dicarboxylate/amino acid:cation symporter [Gammaproteobacteria bacterium]
MTDQVGSLSTVERVHPRSLRYQSHRLIGLVRGRLWLQVLMGMALGIVTGVVLGPSVGWVEPKVATVIGNWLALPGHVFLAALQMIVVPLVVASVARGIASGENIEQLRTVGIRVVLYFVATTIIAAALGIGLALLIEPGTYLDAAPLRESLSDAAPGVAPLSSIGVAGIPDRLVALVPQNPFASMVQREMLQIVIFSVIVGIALVSMPAQQAKPLLELLGSVQAVCITVVRFAMVIAPLAVFGLLAQLTTKTGLSALAGLSVYVVTVLLGLLLLLCLYLVIVWRMLDKGPLWFLGATREVLLLAFSTSSSAAVMPLSIRTAEDNLGVRPSIVQFVVPLGATINMNGTALYQAVATVFLAQLFGIDLSLGQQVLVITIAVASAIGAPATPGVGIVILATLLAAVGVPLGGIALILGVDRLLDMCRTAINVAGDLVACIVMDRIVKGPTTAEQQLRTRKQREALRERSGQDVLVDSGGH